MKMAESSQKGRKHCRKRRICSFGAISLFPTVFPEGLFCRHVKTRVCWERVNSLPNDKVLDWSKLKAFADNKIKVNEKWTFG